MKFPLYALLDPTAIGRTDLAEPMARGKTLDGEPCAYLFTTEAAAKEWQGQNDPAGSYTVSRIHKRSELPTVLGVADGANIQWFVIVASDGSQTAMSAASLRWESGQAD